MNLDKTFCTSEGCVKKFGCDRHKMNYDRWIIKHPQFETRPISTADFTPKKNRDCEYIIGKSEE